MGSLTRTWKVSLFFSVFFAQYPQLGLYQDRKLPRIENLSWRLWLQNLMVDTDNAKSKREFKKLSKCMGEKLDKEKDGSTLFLFLSITNSFPLFSSIGALKNSKYQTTNDTGYRHDTTTSRRKRTKPRSKSERTAWNYQAHPVHFQCRPDCSTVPFIHTRQETWH